MTTAITIQPAGPRDLAMHETQYGRLVDALETEGYAATIDRREERGAVTQAIADIAIHVGEILAADAIIRIGVLATRHLRGLRRPHTGETRYAIIYGPSQEVLRRVSLPEEE